MTKLVRLAARNLVRDRRRTALALLTISAGVAAVLCLAGSVEGFLQIMVDSQVKSKLGDLQITSETKGAFMRQDDPRLKALPDIAGVDGVAMRLQFLARAIRDDVEIPVVGIGIEPSAEHRVCPLAAEEVESGGSALHDGDNEFVVIASDLFDGLGFESGDTNASKIAYGAELRLAVAGSGKELPVRIRGIQKSPFAFDSRAFLLTTLTAAQELTEHPGEVSEIALRLDEGVDVENVKQQVKAALGTGYRVRDWRESQPFLDEAVARSQAVLGVICLVLLVIVAFGIANTMQMNVYERTREIGTLAAVGFSPPRIALLFLIEAVVLGAAGGAIGMILGSVVTWVFREVGLELPKLAVLGVKSLTPAWPLDAMVPTLCATIASAGAAGLMPAIHAARLSPVGALKTT